MRLSLSRIKMSVPDSIVAKVESSIVGRVGSSFFRHSFSFDSTQSHPCIPHTIEHNRFNESFNRPHYVVVHSMIIENKPWANRTVTAYVDSAGDFIEPLMGIPDCMATTSDCAFAIDSVMAVSIVRETGPVGVNKNLGASFEYDDGRWYYGFHKPVWCVTDTISRTHDRIGFNIYLIDPGTGAILKYLKGLSYIHRARPLPGK